MKRTTLLSVFLLMTPFICAQLVTVPGDYPSIQLAIEAASDGDTVIVADSTYYENINFLGRAITVASHFILDGDTSHISNTIIDGSQSANPDTASVVTMWSGEDTTSVLMGFTITGGTGTLDWNIGHTSAFPSGGGVFIKNSGGKICHNIIEHNQVEDSPGLTSGVFGSAVLMFIDNNHNAIFRNNIIRNNIARGVQVWGGAVSLNGGGIIVENNSILNNEIVATGNQKWGTGIAIHNSEVTDAKEEVHIRGNIISGNIGGWGTIGAHGNFGTAKIRIYNNLISDNMAEQAGAIAVTSFETDTEYEFLIYNNTIINNEATLYINSISTSYTVFLKLYNNIIWSADNSQPEIYINDGLMEFYSNILERSFSGASGYMEKIVEVGNTYLEPLFEGDSYMHAANSPAIGRGAESVQIGESWYDAPSSDINGRVRPDPIDGHVDPGAYESGFSRVMMSTAKLLDIRVQDDNLSPGFHPDIMEYSVEVIDTFTAVSHIQAIAEDGLAEVAINHASDIISDLLEERTTTITVTSSDGTAEKIYKVEFIAISTDATLSELSVDGFDVDPEFRSDILDYEVLLPLETTEAPDITAVTSHENAAVSIYDASLEDDSHMTTSIIVTSEAGRAFKETYKIVFQWVHINAAPAYGHNPGVKLFPNPFNSYATLEISDQLSIEKIALVNILGETVRSIDNIEGHTTEIHRDNLPAGLYFLQVRADEMYVMKVLIE